MQEINKKQLVTGISALFIGLLIYFIDRSPGSTYLASKISGGFSFHNIIPGIFGPAGYVLPAFIHVFSFSLITAGLSGSGKKGALMVCSSWLAVNIAFELGQKYKTLAISLIPENYPVNSFLEVCRNYFKTGAFDIHDLMAAVLGAAAAYLIILTTNQRRDNYDYQ